MEPLRLRPSQGAKERLWAIEWVRKLEAGRALDLAMFQGVIEGTAEDDPGGEDEERRVEGSSPGSIRSVVAVLPTAPTPPRGETVMLRFVLFLTVASACAAEAPAPPAPAVAPSWPSLEYSPHRDVAGRFTIEVPAPLAPTIPHRVVRIDRRDLHLYTAMSRVESSGLEIEVSWALLVPPSTTPSAEPGQPQPQESDTDASEPPLRIAADAPPQELLPVFAEAMGATSPSQATAGTASALTWTGHNFSKQWSGLAVAGDDRLYVVRVRNTGKHRFDDAHDRVLASFVPIPADTLDAQARAQTQAYIDDQARREKDAELAAVQAAEQLRRAQAATIEDRRRRSLGLDEQGFDLTAPSDEANKEKPWVPVGDPEFDRISKALEARAPSMSCPTRQGRNRRLITVRADVVGGRVLSVEAREVGGMDAYAEIYDLPLTNCIYSAFKNLDLGDRSLNGMGATTLNMNKERY